MPPPELAALWATLRQGMFLTAGCVWTTQWLNEFTLHRAMRTVQVVEVEPQARRFSVDVDLVTQAQLPAIKAALTQGCQQPPFRSFAYDAPRSHQDDVPRGRYYVYYDSALDQQLPPRHPPRFIAIDLLFEDHAYQQVLQLPIVAAFLEQAGEPRLVAPREGRSKSSGS